MNFSFFAFSEHPSIWKAAFNFLKRNKNFQLKYLEDIQKSLLSKALEKKDIRISVHQKNQTSTFPARDSNSSGGINRDRSEHLW